MSALGVADHVLDVVVGDAVVPRGLTDLTQTI